MNRLWKVAAACLFVLALGAVPAFAQQGDVTPDSTVCTFPKGGGDLQWCVTDHANLIRFMTPNGVETIFLGVLNEGYTLCAAGLPVYYDHGSVEANWGAAVVVANSGSSITIRRTTSDGRFTLLMKFTQDKNERDVTITSTLTNNTAAAIGGIQLVRVADFDHGFQWDDSVVGVWSRGSHAHTLSGITLKFPILSAIHNSFQPPVSCTPTAAAAPSAGDFSAFVRYDIGSLGAGKSATVKYVYRGQ
jgi:hypothetical protein